MFDNDVAGREVGHIIYIIGRCAVACRNGLLWFMLDMCELSEFYLHFNRRTHIFAKNLKTLSCHDRETQQDILRYGAGDQGGFTARHHMASCF